MRVKPILFSSPMVRAILHNKKSQTRRICKIKIYPSRTVKETWDFETKTKSGRNVDVFELNEALLDDADYKVGDVLWVRESFYEPISEPFKGKYFYKAELEKQGWDFKWTPSIHMPKKAARIFLRVSNVRLERLQDISENDAIAEGVELLGFNGVLNCNVYENYGSGIYKFLLAIESFKSLWKSINGEGSWDENTWVWVYDFERVECPEGFR